MVRQTFAPNAASVVYAQVMNRWIALLLLALTSCDTLPQDESARFRVYERRINRLDFPVTRDRLYKTLRPASPARPADNSGSGLLTAGEFYRLDDVFIVEMSVVYKAVTGIDDYLNPAVSIGGQVRSILDATQSLDNFVNRGTPDHPADIIRKARIVRRPAGRYY